MRSDFRSSGSGVFTRLLEISALVAILFVAACTPGKPPQFGVVTTSAQLPAGQISVAYTQTTLTAANGTSPYMWAVTGGALPAGMSLSSAGVLSGTPTASGSFNFTVTATDSATPTARTAIASLTLKVNAPPAITSGTSTTFTVGSAGTFTVTATGFPAPTFSETGALPSGVTLNSTSGVLSGTPAAGSGGTYPITITAQNGTTPNATQNFTLTVDQAPAIASASSTAFAVSVAGTFTVTASGFPAPTLGESGTLPIGVTFNAATGVLSGTPAPATEGSYPITFTAQNGIGTIATQNFTLTVGLAPSITSANSTTFTVGAAGTFTVTAAGFPASTFGETGALPSGVTLNTTTGVLSGTPAANTGGTYAVTITAQNGVTPNATQSFTLTVHQAPAITSLNSTSFTVGSAGTFTVTATGFPAATFGETGPLPSGVTLNTATGVLSGTPASGTQGLYPITITAQNGVLPNATQPFTLTVGLAPAITSANNTTFTVGSAGTFTVTATGFPAPTLGESGALPTGLSFNTATGVLSGTPAANTGGTYPIKFTAQNGINPSVTQIFSLTVNQAPAITSAGSTTFAVGSGNTFTVTASGFPAPTLSQSGTLPSGVTFNPATGVLSGTPASGTQTSSPYSITFTAQNGVGSNANQSFTLNVSFTAPPSITSANNTTFTVGTGGTFTVTANGSPAPTFGESGTLPSGVTFNSSTGVLSGTPATGSGGVYSINFTATNGVNPTANQTFTFTVDEGPAITSNNSTTFTVSVADTFDVTATGEPAATLSETGSLPSGVTFTPNSGGTATLSGTPATGTGGSYPITITAHNGIGTDATQGFTLTVITDPCAGAGTGLESLLNGHYAFVLKGFDNGQGTGETTPEPALVGGVLTFNGTDSNGLITAGAIDMNLNAGTQTNLTVTAGSYKVGSDHRACLTITTSAGTQHYRGSLGNIAAGVASTGHLIDFDASGPFTAGVLRKQSSTVPTTLSGNFAFGVSSGQNTANCSNSVCGGSFGAAGILGFASNLSITGGSVDFNQNGFLDGNSAVGGSWPASPIGINSGGSYSIAASGRGTFTFTPSASGANPVNSVMYVVSSSEVLILNSDPQTSNSAFAGSALLQSGTPFSANPLSGNYVGYQSALGSTAGESSTTLLRLTPSGTAITGTQLRNDSGSFQSKSLPTGITYSTAGSGRMTIVQGGPGNNNPPIFYLVSTSQAFALSSDNSVGFGFFQSQTSTSASGTYAFGTVDPADSSLSDNVGVAVFATPNVNVTEDDNSNGSQNTDQAQSFTFSVDSTGLGEILQPPQTSCTISANSTTCGTVFYVISPTKALVMDTGTTNPKTQVADQ